ncbi:MULTISPECIES: DUF4224 domain-containing protein [Pseudomonas]|uniref:DUF4224 domain-containing protein n=1 Tax=Pseudomonas protegens TaxID=380021 RepID=A0A9Q6IEI0_9PSED|nr:MULTISPECIES: DUF4224 domain-containing protein [Pseudomonas]NMY71270.1 DUF4224 domain-containing protein [Pseudomonas sp. WS 5414]PYC33849.1 hypothetical protein DMX08_19275 [Pseudomonas protegens]
MDIQFLSHQEVGELTGAKTKAGQISVLVRNGIRHTIKRNGWPCVITATLTDNPNEAKEKPTWKPRKAG